MGFNILAIDPGDYCSGYCIMDIATFKPQSFDKEDNYEIRRLLNTYRMRDQTTLDLGPRSFWAVVIERVQSYGMPVGRHVFQTCEWVGRFTELASLAGLPTHYVDRVEEREIICHDPRAGDSNIRRALIDRFAEHDLKNGKGTKQHPDFFYGFHADCWSAFAVGYTFLTKLVQQDPDCILAKLQQQQKAYRQICEKETGADENIPHTDP